jgi:hypothetical protein
VLRRFEAYAVAPGAPRHGVDRLEAACRRCGSHIPEVLDSAVGWNLSEAPVQLVWEHAYASPEAYRRYMVHPFHATVLDRYVLQDSPERVVADDTMGAGLVGYECPGAHYRMDGGVRRLVLLRLDSTATAATADAAAGDAVAQLGEELASVPATVPEMVVSVFGANTMGPAWFDGVTPVSGPPRWTHLWEQGFESLTALASYRRGGSAMAAVERAGWEGWAGGVVRRSAEIYYERLSD